MAMYRIQFKHTPETWSRLLANPEDRRKELGSVMESVGGKLHGMWYEFGDADGFILVEAPDDVTVASVNIQIAASGALAGLSTTKLLTIDEALDAFRRGAGVQYRPPGMPS